MDLHGGERRIGSMSGGEGGSGIINSITRCGTFNYAVLYWSKGRIYCKERQGVFLLFLVLFCFALFLPRNEHVMITKFYF